MNLASKCGVFVREIENYCGNDPLENWFTYACWLERNANESTETNRTILEEIFCKCLSIFEKVANYKQDRRLIKVFVKYVSLQENPTEYLQIMQENGLGTEVADLYVFWASCLELSGDFQAAQGIYQLALKNRAVPGEIIALSKREAKTGSDIRHLGDRRSFFQRKCAKYCALNADNLGSTPGSGVLNENCIPYFDERSESPPRAANQSLVQTIMDSARKARQSARKSHSGTKRHRLDFDDDKRSPIVLNGPNLHAKGIQLPHGFARINLPQRIVKMKPFVDPPYNGNRSNELKISQYNKIMLLPGGEQSYSPEELRAYRWFNRQSKVNKFTAEMDIVWGNGFDRPFRRSFCFVKQNQPQDEEVYPFYDPNTETSSGLFKFAIRIDQIYPKNPTEECSFSEWKRKMNGKRVVSEVKKAPSILRSINQLRMERNQPSSSVLRADQENLVPKAEAAAEPTSCDPPQKISAHEVFVVPTKPPKPRKSSIEFPELNETCTTQSFGMYLKSQGTLSTPKSEKNAAAGTSRKNFNRLSQLMTLHDLSEDASLVEFERMEEEAASMEALQPVQFNIYQDRTVDLQALQAKKAEPNVENQVPDAINDENIEMTICNMVEEKKEKESEEGAEKDDPVEYSGQRKSSSMEYSIEMNSYEKKYIKKAGPATNFTINLPANAVLDEGSDEEDEPEKSIYVPRHEVVFDERKHADWAEVTQFFLDDCKENNYVREEIDLNETRQVIDAQLLNLMSLSPFDANLQKALLKSVSFEEKLAKLDKTVCTLRKVIQPLKPKAQLSIGNRTFTIQKMIASGGFGNVFVGTCDRSRETLAFKQEKPPNLWEYYICSQTHKRIEDKRVRKGCMLIENALIGNNATIFASKFSQYGTLLDVCNKFKKLTGKNLDESLVMVLSKQMLAMVHQLHSAKIIHGDIKPDNFLLMTELCVDYDRADLALQLIDFGQSIDMKLFPPNQVFYSKLKTENFVCTEMLDGLPWNYQHDHYCLAATIYTLVCGKYMAVKKQDGRYSTTMPRYYKKELWMPIFDKLINIPDAKSMPNLLDIMATLDREIAEFGKDKLSKQIVIFNRSLRNK